MLELFAFYSQLGAVETGLLLFLVGLCVGSFSSVLLYRLSLRVPVIWSRSQCTACHHTLRALDLVPVFSFLVGRGRCRYCAARVSVRYLLLEVGCGAFAGIVGGVGGWAAGFGALLAWCVGAWALSAGRRRLAGAESGASLVEVLIALALLMGIVIPMLDFGASLRAATPFQRQMAASLASSKVEELANVAYRTSSSWPGNGEDWIGVGRHSFYLSWTVSPYQPTADDFTGEKNLLRRVEVRVECTNCKGPMAPVRVVSLIAKL